MKPPVNLHNIGDIVIIFLTGTCMFSPCDKTRGGSEQPRHGKVARYWQRTVIHCGLQCVYASTSSGASNGDSWECVRITQGPVQCRDPPAFPNSAHWQDLDAWCCHGFRTISTSCVVTVSSILYSTSRNTTLVCSH